MKKHAIVLGIKKTYLISEEVYFLKKNKPAGIILFKRNINDTKQLKSLVLSIKKILGKETLILIDQEGGKVSRLDPKFWPTFPSSEFFGNLAKKNLKFAKSETYNNYFKIGKILNEVGINFNCAPVLDLKFEKANNIIGSRAFSKEPEIVAVLAYQACKGLLDANVIPIIKHIPGHGRAVEDSHITLPVIKSTLSSLNKKDFYPFKKMKDFPAAMTAHIKYEKIDKKYFATHSRKILSHLIRDIIGFKGIIFSDDICMKALKGNYFNRARKAIKAGCNLILKCDYNLNTSYKALLGSGPLKDELLKKLYKKKVVYYNNNL